MDAGHFAGRQIAARDGFGFSDLRSVTPRLRDRRRRKRRTILIVGGVSCLSLLLILWLTLTSHSPQGNERPAPTADEVGAGRDAILQLRASRANSQGNEIRFGPAQLDGMSALASHGFRPDRLQLGVEAGIFRAAASHRLPGGRWLNVAIVARGHGTGFPETRLTIGSITLPPMLSRHALDIARGLLRLRGVSFPPLDMLVHRYSIGDDTVAATISLPPKSGIIDQMAGAAAPPVDSALVVRIYCALAARQEAQPSADFAAQVRRVFSTAISAPAEEAYNRAAFIALGMLLVDDRVGDLAGAARRDSAGCRILPITTRVYGRSDWPKHWALSAALSAGAGTQLAEAMGEWKELADSLARQSRFAVGDPSGFSFADLAADRSGFRVAQRAVRARNAAAMARRLSGAGPEQLLPRSVTLREDGLSKADFATRYGGISDARFRTRVREIDRTLDREGLTNG